MGRLLPPRSKISQESQETLHHEVKPACEHGVLVMEGKQLIQDKIAMTASSANTISQVSGILRFAAFFFSIIGLLSAGSAGEAFSHAVYSR